MGDDDDGAKYLEFCQIPGVITCSMLYCTIHCTIYCTNIVHIDIRVTVTLFCTSKT